MDLLTKTDLEQLAERDRAERHVSLFIPTHHYGPGTQTDRIRWKNLLNRVGKTLEEQGARGPEIAELLAPAWQLRDDHVAWRYMSDGLAMFLRPGWHRLFRVPATVPEIGAVGDRFVIGPLLRILTGDSHFLVLTVSQRRVRLLEGSMLRVEELELTDVPTALQDVIEPPESRSDTMTFPLTSGARGGGAAVFYGHGTSDDDFKKNQVRAFLRQVADRIGEYLTDHDLPLVLVGLDEMVATYRDVNRYPHVVDDSVRRNPDGLSAEELHAATWPVVESLLAAERQAAAQRFREQHGTGLAIDNPSKIEEAARNGRIDSLFLATEPWCWEQLDADAATVKLGSDLDFSHCELLDRVAVDTLAARGRVYAVPAEDVPGGGDVAAILRY